MSIETPHSFLIPTHVFARVGGELKRIALADIPVDDYQVCANIERIEFPGSPDNPSYAYPQFRASRLVEIRVGGSRCGTTVARFGESA